MNAESTRVLTALFAGDELAYAALPRTHRSVVDIGRARGFADARALAPCDARRVGVCRFVLAGQVP